MIDGKRAVIIGGGPAGLTAAYEFLARSSIRPIVLEASGYMGGISRTVNYKGNRIDLGGHRFFSKSDRVMRWWLDVLPLEASNGNTQSIMYQRQTRDIQTSPNGPDPNQSDRVMLLRKRKSRIYFLRQFFDYPISLSPDTLRKLGLLRTVRIGMSYVKSVLFPIKDESNLEQFFINRFGHALYRLFFKSYTEKVWGVPCNKISAEWGAQRVKGLSIWKTVTHFLRKALDRGNSDFSQKQTETSLIEQFLYPKYGPGQMWEEVANQIRGRGGQIRTDMQVCRILMDGSRVRGVEAVDTRTGETSMFEGDYVFSTMPIKELVRAMDVPAPPEIRRISDGLIYRDFITVGLLLKKLKISEKAQKPIEDNWIYIQEPDVLVGRMQIFNNWSPYLVADPSTTWIGLEYFCYETDEIWSKSNKEMIELAKDEIARIGIIEPSDVLDGHVLRMPKTYPAYFGTYAQFEQLRAWLDGFENLFLVGRNGMHKYNNQDHSMLTAMVAVENILAGRKDKDNIWAVNTEQDYHESAQTESAEAMRA